MKLMPLLIAFILLVGCKPSTPDSEPRERPADLSDIESQPEVTPADETWAGVFEPLDGRWRGVFNVYVNQDGQTVGEPRPKELHPERWKSAPFEKTLELDVEQEYESISPYFQRVRIVDTYPDGKVVESRGVNKVQSGQLWCVVKKPDDLVIHRGEHPDPRTIIWSRDRESPKAIEYFVETVNDETYEIIGWGYYGKDDPSLPPRMFFEAHYERM